MQASLLVDVGYPMRLPALELDSLWPPTFDHISQQQTFSYK